MRRKDILITIFVIVFCLGTLVAWADEIEKNITDGLSAYKGKEYTTAIKHLESAAHKIRQKKATEIEALFPEPLSGWSAGKPESAALGSIFMGGAISASRTYEKGVKSVKIEIVSDSPLISIVTGLLSTPMLSAASPIFKIISVKGHDAVLEWKEYEKAGDIKIVIESKVLVTISATRCQKNELLDYANAVDYDKVYKLASK